MKDKRTLTFTIENSIETTVGEWLDTHQFPRKTMKDLFSAKGVRLDGQICTAKTRLSQGMVLEVMPLKERIDHDPIEMPLVIAYEDEDILIVDKPSGITMNSKGQVSLANGVAHYFKVQNIYGKVRFLNRLDRDTAGLVIVAKHGLAQHFYQLQMDDNRLEKWYRATVQGRLEQPHEVLEVAIHKSADGIHQEIHPEGVMTKTEYEVLHYDAAQDTTDVRIRLWTGKTHQIRVTMAHIGHPLAHDPLYADEGVLKRKQSPCGIDDAECHKGLQQEVINTAKGQVKDIDKTFALRAYRLVYYHMRTGAQIIIEI
ncbi:MULTISPECIES: RluA family pseudouridine synthase [unclassified Veillonella]|uniref:RluA family pseudouridine synthase n=1 Tax=unclassified Veillonella TaxID=2630086 RepID=UPI001F0BF6EB|nr:MULTISPECIES: RluA family pseudouridine synthase [unclassified Veillonella]